VQLGMLVTAWVQRGATWRGLVRLLLLAVAMLVVARVLFQPFWAHYAPPVRQWGWVLQESAPLKDVLTIFGIFLVATVPSLLQTIRGWTRDRSWAGATLITAFTLTVIAGSLRSPACALFLGWAFIGGAAWTAAGNAAVRTAALLVAAAGCIGAATETVFVWDRMNTVFKYYLQMWLLLGCGSAILVWSAVQGSRRRWTAAIPVAAVAAAGLFTSVTGVIGYVKTPHAASPILTLDGLAYLHAANPSELAAFAWVNREIVGIPVMLEAHGPSYQAFSRVSMNTGLPTLVGWQYHLFQQGRSREEIEMRARDVREIYQTADAVRLEALLRNYRIDFIFVGSLERATYGAGIVERFERSALVEPVFRSGTVTIFAVPGRVNTVKTWIEKATPPPVPIDPASPLREPRGLAVAPDGTILIADFGNRRVQRIGRDKVPIAAFGVAGDGPVQFRDPAGIAVGADGRIWVADTWNHRIQALTPDGRQVREWHGALYGPRGIALGPGGVVYLTDTGNKRLLRFASDGTFDVVGAKGLLDNPVGVAVGGRGEIYVADAGHRRIVVLSPAGQVLREWPIDGWQNSSRMEPYIAVGPDGVLWVTDPPNGRVLLFTRDGESLGIAVPESPLRLPLGVAVIDQSTAVVTDAVTNAVVSVSRPAGRPGSSRSR
jgi:hypothetical protein